MVDNVLPSAELFLFRSGKFYPLKNDGVNFIAPVSTGINKPLIPSTFINSEHLANLRNLCENFDGYILGPYYSEGDYQLLVTGKTILQVDKTIEDAIIREMMEETGVKPNTLKKTPYGYNVNIADCEFPDLSVPIYGELQNFSRQSFAQYEESRYKQSKKINTVIYGRYDDYYDLYADVKVKRPKFAETNIIGFVIIPTKKVLKDLL